MTDNVKRFGKKNRSEQEAVAEHVRDGAPLPVPRAERTRWQMSLTVDERRWLDRRSSELGLTRSGYVKRLLAEDRARVEREESGA